jgi:polyisoprenoid-binding protein YceI
MRKTLLISSMLVAAGSVAAEPATFVIDPGHSVVTFETLHLGTSTHRGRFQVAKDGTIVLDRVAKTGKADVAVDIASVSIASSSLENFLKGERAFNAAQNPTARFVGDAFTFDGAKVASVAGTLTILGKSQPVTLKATRFNCYENGQLKREVCGGDFETTIQRSQFGLGFAPGAAPDDVHLLIQVEGIRQP